MDDHTVSWASVIYVALGTGAAGYLLGAASTALVFGLLRALRKKECRSDARSSMAARTARPHAGKGSAAGGVLRAERSVLRRTATPNAPAVLVHILSAAFRRNDGRA